VTVRTLFQKADQARTSAQTLLNAGDVDGACNRAYYAMFDAARARLMAQGFDLGKTHRGVLNAFGEHLIKSGLVSTDLGRLLKRAEAFRYVADYESGSIAADDARWLVDQAEVFVRAMHQACDEGTKPD
jgi:uncharacterized protein (UPF0332 family)